MAPRSYTTIKEILRPEGLEKAAYWRRFAMLLTLSVIIATMGLLRDSSAVVIAAILVAPLMTPILGIAAMLVAPLMTPILGIAAALAAGVAAAYVQIRRSEISLLPGAAIGVALVPPLSAAGILAHFGQLTAAYEALLLFLTNLGAIVLSACTVYLFFALRAALRPGRQRLTGFSAGLVANLCVLAFVLVQLASATYQRYEAARAETRVVENIIRWAEPVSVEIIRVDIRPARRAADIWLIIDVPITALETVQPMTDMVPQKLQEVSLIPLLAEELGVGYEITLRLQTRFAGRRITGTTVVQPADAPRSTLDEE